MQSKEPISEMMPRIESAVERVLTLVGRMSPEHAAQPLLDGGRSVKDVLAHMTWWDRWLLMTLPPEPGQTAAGLPLALADEIPSGVTWADEMNAKVLEYNRGRSFAEIWADLTVTCEALLQRVRQLTDADLYDPDGMSALVGWPVSELVGGIHEHYDEHAHEFERIA